MTALAHPTDNHFRQARAAGDLMGQFGVRMMFAAGEEIYAQDEEADMIYQLVSGSARTTRLARDGRRQIGDFYEAGDVFGLDQGSVHRFSAEALADCEVLVVRRKGVVLAAGQEAFDHFLAQGLASALERAQDHLILVGRRSAQSKVAGFLLDVARRQAGPTFTLPMGRQDMADYLDLTIETVSRMLTQLQAQKCCRFSGCRTYVICDRERLAGAVD